MTPGDPARAVHALLLHGAGGGAWEWGLWTPVLEAHGIGAHAIDLPHATGASASGLQDALDAVHAALAALPGPRALVGASLGGLLAVACADGADAVVLLNPLPPAPWADAVETPAVDTLAWGARARLASTRAAVPDADPATALAAFRRWRDCPARLLREARMLTVERTAVPAWMLVSAADADIPPAAMRAWAGAWGIAVEDAGATSHAGVLLGRDAPALAARAAGWLLASLRG